LKKGDKNENKIPKGNELSKRQPAIHEGPYF